MSSPQLIEKIANKIHNHFTQKYPNFYTSLNIQPQHIQKILKAKKGDVSNKKVLNEVIDTLDKKILVKLHTPYANSGYAMEGNQQMGELAQIIPVIKYATDNKTQIGYDKFLDNYKYDNLTRGNNTDNNSNKKTSVEMTNTERFNQLMLNRDAQNEPLGIPPKVKVPSFNNVDDIKPKEINTTVDTQFTPESTQFDEENKNVVGKLMTEELVEKSFYITIDSKDRNTTTHTSPNEYVIKFGSSSGDTSGFILSGYQNVISIELVEAILIDTSSTPGSSDNGSNFPYLLLEIQELGSMFQGTNDNISKSLAILKDYTLQNGYKYYKLAGGTVDERIIKVFNPRITLSKMTVKICLPNGTEFAFGSSNDSNADTVNCFIFKIKTLEKKLTTSSMDNTTF